jgi:hypothetical protein
VPNELERIRSEVIVALFEVCSGKLYGIFLETVKKLGIASISDKI